MTLQGLLELLLFLLLDLRIKYGRELSWVLPTNVLLKTAEVLESLVTTLHRAIMRRPVIALMSLQVLFEV